MDNDSYTTSPSSYAEDDDDGLHPPENEENQHGLRTATDFQSLRGTAAAHLRGRCGVVEARSCSVAQQHESSFRLFRIGCGAEDEEVRERKKSASRRGRARVRNNAAPRASGAAACR